MRRVTVVDIQHKTFKRALPGYDRGDVDRFLDEVIETLEEEAQARRSLESEVANLRERIAYFTSMEETLQATLLLAQRTADDLKASAHKEADLICAEARVGVSKEQSFFDEGAAAARQEYRRALESAERAKGELRTVLNVHLALLDRAPDSAGASDAMSVGGASYHETRARVPE